MPNLINNSAELKANFGALSLNYTWINISSYAEDAERDIIAEAIGAEALDYFTNHLTGLSGVQASVLQLLQRSVSYFTIYTWSQFALFQFEDKALYLAKTTTGAIPSDKKLQDLRGLCAEKSYTFLDQAIDLMERNLNLFQEYAGSAPRLDFQRGFIRTAGDFNRIRTIKNSRLTFLSMHSLMLDAQDEKLPAYMSPAYYELFKERFLDDELGLTEKKLLPLVQKAVAMFTLAEAMAALPVEVTSQGIFINRFNNSIDWAQKDAAATARLDFMKDDFCEKGDRALLAIQNFIKANAADLPGYVAPVIIDINLNDDCSGFYYPN